jgi:HlyD family secretion protein
MKLWTVSLAALLCTSCAFNSDKPDGSGTMECTQVRIAAEVPGRITCLTFAEGDTVTNGQILATLDKTPYQLRRDEAAAALALAQAQLDLMNAGSRSEDILRARAQVREARAMADAAATDSKRMETLFEQNSITTKQRDDAATAAERTSAGLAATEQQLDRLVKGNRLEEIQAALAAVALSKARLAQADKAIADCIITAPMAGIITTKSTEPGEVIAIGAPMATLSRMDEVWLSLYLPETKLAGIKTGQKATVKIDGDPARYAGTITFISAEAEFTPRNVQTPDERVKLVYRIKVTLPNPKGIFKPGMPADGYL